MLLFKIAVLTEVEAVTATDPLVIAIPTVRQAINSQPVVLSDCPIARSAVFPTSYSQVEM